MPEAFAEDAQEHEEREPSERKRERADDHPRTVPAVEEISAPGSVRLVAVRCIRGQHEADNEKHDEGDRGDTARSEEHTSELQSQSNLVCRLLLEKKKNNM